MPGDTRTRAQQNRAIRQEELRKQLASQKHLEKASDSINKIKEAADDFEVRKYKAVFDSHFKLAGKYLPDLKANEISGELGVTVLNRNSLAGDNSQSSS